jgi:uncharacterized membrane protein
MISVDADPCADYFLVAQRNNSLSRSERQWVLGFICAASGFVALGFAAFGAWPVLPFAGLEMAVLYWAFRYIDRHAGDYERLEISGDRVVMEVCEGGVVRLMEFNRQWARVVMTDSQGRGRLALRSHGREVEFGRHLTHEARERVARELRQRLGKA